MESTVFACVATKWNAVSVTAVYLKTNAVRNSYIRGGVTLSFD